ncbi:MAG: tetratricopeptide repeat protein [Bacteroidota bacterium]
MGRFVLLLFLFTAVAEGALAQSQALLDSMQAKLEAKDLHDTSRVDVLNELAYLYTDIDSLKAAEFTKKALSLAERVNYQNGFTDSYNNTGWRLIEKSKYEESRRFFERGLEIAKRENYLKGQSSSYEGLGIVARRLGNYLLALEYYFDALSIRKATNDTYGMATSYNNLGIIYFYQKNYEKASEYYQKSAEISGRLAFKSYEATALLNIGEVEYYLGNYEKSVQFYKRSLSRYEELESENGIAYCFHGLGETFSAIGKADSAMIFLENAIQLRRKLQEPANVSTSLILLGKIHFNKKEYFEAEKALVEALQIGQEIEYLESIKSASEWLSQVYAAQKRFDKAYEQQLLFKQTSDTLANEERTKKLAFLEAEYDFEKERIAFKEERLRKQATQRATSIGLGLASLLVIGTSFFLWDRQRANRKLTSSNTQLEKAHSEIRDINLSLLNTLSVVQAQQRSITDSIHYAQRIQNAILPTKEQLTEFFPEHFIFFRPRDIVSGDFYWFGDLSKEQGKVVLSVIDCTGHGVPGAFMSMVCNDLLNYLVNEKQLTEPDQILTELHKEIRRALRQDQGDNRDGMELGVVAWDKNENTVSFAGAKNSLVYYQDGKRNRLTGSKRAIGGDHRSGKYHFESHEIKIDRPTTLYLFSDGYKDQFGGKRERKFMSKHFLRLLDDLHTLPMEEQRNKLETTFDDWRGDLNQLDDVLVMGVRIG